MSARLARWRRLAEVRETEERLKKAALAEAAEAARVAAEALGALLCARDAIEARLCTGAAASGVDVSLRASAVPYLEQLERQRQRAQAALAERERAVAGAREALLEARAARKGTEELVRREAERERKAEAERAQREADEVCSRTLYAKARSAADAEAERPGREPW